MMMLATRPLGRRGFGPLLLAAAAASAVVVLPGYGLGATDDPPAPLRTVNVSNSTQLNTALQNAQPGDHIVLANATYSGNRTLARAGTPGAPIVVKAASKHGATISGGTLHLDGQHTIAYGLRFTGTGFGVLPRADNTWVLRNWFTGPRGVRVTTAQNVRIGYNRFSGNSNGSTSDNQVDVSIASGTSVRLPEGLRVYRNDMSSPGGASDEDSFHIYVGPAGGTENTPSVKTATIEYNRIADTVRKRGVYSKRGGIIRFNHIIGKGPGVNGIRHGGEGQVDGNRLSNVDSLILNGPDHQVRGNHVRARRGIVLESEWTTSDGIKHQAAHRALLIGNDASATVVGNYDGGTLIAPVDGVRIYNHVGSVVLRQQTNTVWEQAPRPDMSAPTPITLSPRQVGPDAP
jgi:hypothetical protein